MQEEWRAIAGYDAYEVSNIGRVRRLWSTCREPRIRRLTPTRQGYLTIQLPGRTYRVHRLVASAFLGPPPTPKHEANHKDGVKTNCAANNLEWTTPAENQRHAYATGLRQRKLGEETCNVKLTAEKVLAIRAACAQGESRLSISRRYDITKQTVGHIERRQTWKHLPTS